MKSFLIRFYGLILGALNEAIATHPVNDETALVLALIQIRAVLNRRDRSDLENEAFHIANRALLPFGRAAHRRPAERGEGEAGRG